MAFDDDYIQRTGTVRSNLSYTSTKTLPGKSSYTIYLLDGQPVQIQIDRKSKGRDLFETCCANMDTPIDEKFYFALSFDIKEHGNLRRTWIDFNKPCARQMINAPNKALAMNVKFYPPDPTQLLEYTRYLFYLQLRDDVCKGKMQPMILGTQKVLGSYICQADVGDYQEGENYDFLYDFPFGPGDNSAEMVEGIIDIWKGHRGMTTGEAELNYLENAKKLPMYGTELYPCEDADNIEIDLGINWSGVLVFKNKTRINRISWPKVLKISYKRDYFYIRVRPAENDKYEKTIGFKTEGYKAAKRLWKICVEHHAFFRLVRTEPKSKKIKFGSKPNMTFQTEYQVRKHNETLRSQYQTFDRYNTMDTVRSLSLTRSGGQGNSNRRAFSMDEILGPDEGRKNRHEDEYVIEPSSNDQFQQMYDKHLPLEIGSDKNQYLARLELMNARDSTASQQEATPPPAEVAQQVERDSPADDSKRNRNDRQYNSYRNTTTANPSYRNDRNQDDHIEQQQFGRISPNGERETGLTEQRLSPENMENIPIKEEHPEKVYERQPDSAAESGIKSGLKLGLGVFKRGDKDKRSKDKPAKELKEIEKKSKKNKKDKTQAELSPERPSAQHHEGERNFDPSFDAGFEREPHRFAQKSSFERMQEQGELSMGSDADIHGRQSSYDRDGARSRPNSNFKFETEPLRGKQGKYDAGNRFEGPPQNRYEEKYRISDPTDESSRYQFDQEDEDERPPEPIRPHLNPTVSASDSFEHPNAITGSLPKRVMPPKPVGFFDRSRYPKRDDSAQNQPPVTHSPRRSYETKSPDVNHGYNAQDRNSGSNDLIPGSGRFERATGDIKGTTDIESDRYNLYKNRTKQNYEDPSYRYDLDTDSYRNDYNSFEQPRVSPNAEMEMDLTERRLPNLENRYHDDENLENLGPNEEQHPENFYAPQPDPRAESGGKFGLKFGLGVFKRGDKSRGKEKPVKEHQEKHKKSTKNKKDKNQADFSPERPAQSDEGVQSLDHSFEAGFDVEPPRVARKSSFERMQEQGELRMGSDADMHGRPRYDRDADLDFRRNQDRNEDLRPQAVMGYRDIEMRPDSNAYNRNEMGDNRDQNYDMDLRPRFGREELEVLRADPHNIREMSGDLSIPLRKTEAPVVQSRPNSSFAFGRKPFQGSYEAGNRFEGQPHYRYEEKYEGSVPADESLRYRLEDEDGEVKPPEPPRPNLNPTGSASASFEPPNYIKGLMRDEYQNPAADSSSSRFNYQKRGGLTSYGFNAQDRNSGSSDVNTGSGRLEQPKSNEDRSWDSKRDYSARNQPLLADQPEKSIEPKSADINLKAELSFESSRTGEMRDGYQKPAAEATSSRFNYQNRGGLMSYGSNAQDRNSGSSDVNTGSGKFERPSDYKPANAKQFGQTQVSTSRFESPKVNRTEVSTSGLKSESPPVQKLIDDSKFDILFEKPVFSRTDDEDLSSRRSTYLNARKDFFNKAGASGVKEKSSSTVYKSPPESRNIPEVASVSVNNSNSEASKAPPVAPKPQKAFNDRSWISERQPYEPGTRVSGQMPPGVAAVRGMVKSPIESSEDEMMTPAALSSANGTLNLKIADLRMAPEIPTKPSQFGSKSIRSQPETSSKVFVNSSGDNGSGYYSESRVYSHEFNSNDDAHFNVPPSERPGAPGRNTGGLSDIFKSQFGDASHSRGSNVKYQTEKETTVHTRTTTHTVRGMPAMIFFRT